MSKGWIAPEFSKSRVNKAGNAIRIGEETQEDLDILENWRRAHARILNTHQMRLRRLTGLNFTIAQRLKRRPTIIDKLSREPKMQLARMHDIAGCRVIFDDLDSLNAYREAMFSSRAKHVHVNEGNERFDYIKNPKRTGYRGIHEVFATRTGRTDGKAWDGLKVEVQLRTKAQHAWATAVETIDLLNGERAKFGEAEKGVSDFFLLASEVIARAHEASNSALPKLSNRELVERFSSIDDELGIVRRLDEAVMQNPILEKDRTTILIFHFDTAQGLEVRSYTNILTAVLEYEKFEKKYEGSADVVLVRADKTDDLRKSFQNYFSDAQDFVALVTDGITSLS